MCQTTSIAHGNEYIMYLPLRKFVCEADTQMYGENGVMVWWWSRESRVGCGSVQPLKGGTRGKESRLGNSFFMLNNQLLPSGLLFHTCVLGIISVHRRLPESSVHVHLGAGAASFVMFCTGVFSKAPSI